MLIVLLVLCCFASAPLAAEEPATRQLGPIDLIRSYTRTQLATAGFVRQEAEVAGRTFVWWQAGEGPTLVLIHGVSDQAGSWFQVAPQLATSYRVLLVDLPGHGESLPAEGPLPMSVVLDGFETWLAAHAVAADGPPPILVGNSMGAWIALMVARRHPEQVSRVVVVNGGPLRFEPPQGLSLLPKTRDEARAVMAALRDPSSPATPDPILDDLVRRVEFNETRRMFDAQDDLDRHLFADDELAQVAVPVDLVWGTSDRYLGKQYPQRLLAGLPSARLTALEACGHVPQAECPVPFLEVLTRVLDSPPPSAGPDADPGAEP